MTKETAFRLCLENPSDLVCVTPTAILLEFAGDSLDKAYRPYSAAEVARLRQSPLNEVENYRAQLLADIGR